MADPSCRSFPLDLRSLACCRVVLAVTILFDLWVMRGPWVFAHQTDGGILPRGAQLTDFLEPAYFSVHYVNGTFGFQLFLNVLASLFALGLLVGWRTRLFTILSWFMLCSLQSRNPMILQGGDVLLRLLLFWGMFLPLGGRWSVDALHAKGPARAEAYSSLAGVFFLLQVCGVYWMAVLFKSGPHWWGDFDAVYYALHIDQLATPLGVWMRELPIEWLRWMTRLTVALEVVAPLFVLMPFFNGWMRCVGVFLLLAMHGAFALTIHLGPFPFANLASLVALLPGCFWGVVLSRVQRHMPGAWNSIPARVGRIFPAGDILSPESAGFFECLRARFRWVVPVFLSLCFVWCVWWNIGTLKPEHKMPGWFSWLGVPLRLDQQWGMFSPHPLKEDGWFVISATTRDGREIDLLAALYDFETIRPVTWEKPRDVAAMYRGERWRKYLMNLWLPNYEKHRLYFGQYLSREWNNRRVTESRGPTQVTEFEIFYVQETTPAPGKTGQTVPVAIWKHFCFEVPKAADPKTAEVGHEADGAAGEHSESAD